MPSADPEALSKLDDYFIHGRHPSGRLLAAEVWELMRGECCVWDLQTGDLVWRPKAVSISWSSDGAAIALLVGEYGDRFELRSWPGRKLISRCIVTPWACCNTYVTISPRGDRAAVLWWHQTEGGFNLVALEGGAARHLEGQGYTTRETNCVQGPTFSPDGRLVAMSEGFTWWWLPEPGENPEEEPSPGGTFRRGCVTIVDIDSGSLHQLDVFGEVKGGWIPPHEGWEHFELLGRPYFTSVNEIVLSPEFGDSYRLTVPPPG